MSVHTSYLIIQIAGCLNTLLRLTCDCFVKSGMSANDVKNKLSEISASRESFCSSYLKHHKFLPVRAFLLLDKASMVIMRPSTQGNLKVTLSTVPQITLLLKMIPFPETGIFHVQLGYSPVLHLLSLKYH